VSIFVALHHVTYYKYDRPIDLGPQTIRLRTAPHTRTPIVSYSLTVTPSNHFVNWQQDPQGNWLARFVFPEKATELKIEVDFMAQMTVLAGAVDLMQRIRTDFKYDPKATVISTPLKGSRKQRLGLAVDVLLVE
jgi:transglutaminase-like putative cysteine protease